MIMFMFTLAIMLMIILMIGHITSIIIDESVGQTLSGKFFALKSVARFIENNHTL